MTQSNDSILLKYEWADRGMIQYLQLVNTEKLWNMQLAKVYYQGGEIHSSTVKLPDYVNPETVAALIVERREYLQQKVVERVIRQLDKALT